jgi:hypothetical protein
MYNNNKNYEIPSYEEEVIVQYWLQGKTRDEIAQAFEVSQGTISNIWKKFRNKLGQYEAETLRELGKQLRRQNITAENCAKGFRISKIMEKLKIPEEEMEEFLTTIYEILQKKGINPETLRDAIIEFAQISDKLPFSELPSYLQKRNEEIKEKENKKKQLEEEIQNLEKEKLAKEEEAKTAVREANTTLFHLNNYRETKVKLAKFGIIVEDTFKFTQCVEGVARHSNFDPFKVIEKFSNLDKLEKEIENKQKEKNNLEINIERLKDTESESEERLNLKSLKLKNLEELEKTGFTIQDLKRLKMMLIEIGVEHNMTSIEQIKAKFFEECEKLEDRMTLESKNNAAMQLNLILENMIRTNRQIFHCQEVIGDILKNLLQKGITEDQIVRVKALIDRHSYNLTLTGLEGRGEEGNNIAKTNIKHENLNVSNKSNNYNNNRNYNWKKEYQKSIHVLIPYLLTMYIFFINLEKIKCDGYRFRISLSPILDNEKILDFDNDDDVKWQGSVADSII